MGPRGSRFTVLGLGVFTALALSAFSAASARADFEWAIEGHPVAAFGGAEKIKGSGGTFTLTLESLGTTVTCEKQTTTAGSEITEGGNGTATIQFSECELSLMPSCEVAEPVSANTKAELREASDGNVYVYFEPVSGTVFTTISLSGCLLSGAYPIEGDVAGEPGTEQVEQPITFSPAISAAAETQLTMGESLVTLEGVSNTVLDGENEGKSWVGAYVSPSPLKIDFGKIKKGQTPTKVATFTNMHETKKVKYALAQAVGGGGAFTLEKDGCSNKEIDKKTACTITVKFAPTKDKEEYAGILTLPWEEGGAGKVGAVAAIFLAGETE